MTTTGIPHGPDDLTTQWLENALNAPDGSLSSFSHTPVGTGQVAGSYRLSLDWSNHDAPSSMVLKCASPDETSRGTGSQMQLYAKEVNWYRDLAPKTDVRCPECYAASISDDGAWFALLLEDCAPAQQGDQLAGVSEASVRLAMEEAVRLHSAFFNSPVLESAFSEFSDNKELARGLMKTCWPAFKERYVDRLAPDIMEMGDAFMARYDTYLDREPTHLTISHNDFRVDNMLFGGPDGRVVVLDWQTVFVGPPVHDLAYLMGASFADASHRQRVEDDIVRSYHDGMNQRGAHIGWDETWQAYRIGAFSSFVTAVISAMIVQRTERGDEMFAVMAERPAQQIIDLDALTAF